MPIGSLFGANFSPHNWEVLAQSLCKKTEYFQYSPDIDRIVQNHSSLIDLAQLPKDNEKCPHLLVQAIADRINKGIIAEDKWGTTQNAITINDKLIADI